MKNSIYSNTKKRTNAVNSLEKDFFKFMINSVYGKTMNRKVVGLSPVVVT